MDKIRFSRYRNVKSIVHNIDPISKLISFILIAVTVFLANNISELLIVLGFVFLIAICAKVNFFTYTKLFIMLLPFFILLFLPYYLVTFDLNNSLYITGEIFIRMYVFILTAVIYTSTTKEIAISNSISTLIYPLKFIKVPVYEISLMLMLAIRFIPLILLDLYKIFLAQTSRGINSINGTLKDKIISFKNAFLPLFVLAFKRSENISISMEIRGYKMGQKRTKFFKNKFKFLEFFSLLIMIGFLIIIILINIHIIPGDFF